MAEYTEKRWRCDFCSRDVKKGDCDPPGWEEIKADFYGNLIHCCPEPACTMALSHFLENDLSKERGEAIAEERARRKK